MSVSCPSGSRHRGGRSDGRGADEQAGTQPDDILARLESSCLTPAAASELLRVSERQVYRPMRRFRNGGPAGIAARRRGRPSNNRLPDVLRHHAVALVREHSPDYGPTLAAEKLQERRALRISRETLRTRMIYQRANGSAGRSESSPRFYAAQQPPLYTGLSWR